MADAIVSAVLQQLLTIIDREVEQEVRLVVGVEKEVKKMKSTFEAIKDVLEDAENRQYLPEGKAVKGWLDELKHVSFDIDDVLDEWKTAILKSRIERDQVQSFSTPSLLRKVCSCIPFPCSSFGGVALRRDIAHKIRELNENLHGITKQKERFSFVAIQKSITDQNFERPNTKSLIDESKVFGRDDDKNKLIRSLLSDKNGEGGSGEGIPVIAIVGMGGLGKTTLAQLVYNNDEVKKHFSQRIWVCVSDPFDEVRIAKAILEALQGTPSSFNEPENLFQEIHRNVEGKKFLLVLDDVWTNDENKWEPLKLSLAVGSKESKILVTTRNKQVASILGCPKPIFLGMLSGEDSWYLFSKIAFFERSDQDRKNLESIGRKFVLKCAGLPLAIKTIASLLRFKVMKEQWERILVSEMWDFEEVRKDLCAPLLLSYYDLPVAEKQCFSYCAIFPKDHRIERDEVVRLWMAQGFLGETREVNDLEIIGVECFNNLAIRNFFQEFEERFDGNIRCKMHDIVHDFAQFLTEKECVLDESDGGTEVQKRVESSHENVRYLTLINPPRNHDPILDPFKKLHSFLILSTVGNPEAISFASLPKLFHQLINLRTFIFDNRGWKEERCLEIPKEIGKLIHLRYLSLKGNTGLYTLPEALCDLCNLQILNIGSCSKLQQLPRGMEKLINLRHLLNEGTNRLTMPKGLKRLTCLQTLEEFYVRKKGGGIESETSFSLKDLGKLIHLRGNLKIRGLGNVAAEASEAREAQLSTKTGLRSLTLCFDGGDDMEQQTWINDDALLVFEALQPPQDLQNLGIERCKGPTYPNWMTSLTSLKSVELCCCLNWESLPPMGKLPCLESLIIWGMNKVKKVGEEFVGVETTSCSVNHDIAFPSLKELTFSTMGGWEEWEYDKVLRSRRGDDSYSSSSSSNISIMPKLQGLSIIVCPKLKTLPRHLLQNTALQDLIIIACPILERHFNKETGDDWSSISHIPTVHLL